MPRLPGLATGFRTLRELDLSAIRRQAEQPFHIAVVGAPGVGKSTLIDQLLSGPGAAEPGLFGFISERQLDQRVYIEPYSVVILMLDASQAEHSSEREALERLRLYRVPTIVCYNKLDLLPNPRAIAKDARRWQGTEVVAISARVRETVLQKLVPVLMRTYKDREMVLARHLPMLREPVCHKLIEDTSHINAVYSLTSGLAALNVLLIVPVNVTDIVVLTKNQAVMAYKISLACGLPADWRQTIPKLTTVVGTAFLWRTIARQLVGLVPVIGVVPKVAVAYAGTYAVGQAIYRWCASSERVSPQALRDTYSRALTRGRQVARSVLSGRGDTRQDSQLQE